MKYVLFFENTSGNKRIVGKYNSQDECYKAIIQFCEERHFKVYYTRRWMVDNRTMKVDVGSHTEFFYIEEVA